jgi:HSP20 family protein
MTLFKPKKGTEITPSEPGTPYNARRPESVFFEDFDSIFENFRRSFDHLMMPMFPSEFGPLTYSERQKVHYAPLDLIDEGDHFKVRVELPGMTREDVEVNITYSGLSVEAHKEEQSEKNDKNYLHRERYYSSFRRNIRFPEEVESEKAEGTMKDGILELSIPKKEPKPRETVHKIELK